SRRRHTRFSRDWSSDVCSSDLELQGYFAAEQAGQRLQAIPATGTNVPLWILGSSMFGAHLAAELGLPYAFASHFAPDLLLPALEIGRASCRDRWRSAGAGVGRR